MYIYIYLRAPHLMVLSSENPAALYCWVRAMHSAMDDTKPCIGGETASRERERRDRERERRCRLLCRTMPPPY